MTNGREETYDNPPIFDVSAKTYEEFILFLFDRSITEDVLEREDLFYGNSLMFEVAQPERFVAYIIRTFNELSSLVVRYSAKQVAQGLKQLFDPMSLNCCRWMFVQEVRIEVRVECIRSMYDVFVDVVAKWAEPEVPDCFYMWWHDMGNAYWKAVAPVRDYSELGDEAQSICDTMFETLVKILQLPERVCHTCALHGLGHLGFRCRGGGAGTVPHPANSGVSDCLMLSLARKTGHLPLGTFDRALGKVQGTQKL